MKYLLLVVFVLCGCVTRGGGAPQSAHSYRFSDGKGTEVSDAKYTAFCSYKDMAIRGDMLTVFDLKCAISIIHDGKIDQTTYTHRVFSLKVDERHQLGGMVKDNVTVFADYIQINKDGIITLTRDAP